MNTMQPQEATNQVGKDGQQQEQDQQQQQKKKPAWSFLKDPRRLTHPVKVGLALTLSSLFMLLEEPPRLLGENAIWAIMTVVVVFELTVGATLSKGLNRGLGTFAAAFVGIGVSHLADLFGEIGEASIIIAAVFVIGTIATFVRFIPRVRIKYDYGVLIFILTFSLITVSSYQTDGSFPTASNRMFYILVGCGITLAICMFLFPVWAGEDLHALLSHNFEIMAECLHGSVGEYFERPATTMQAVMEKEAQNRAYNDEISLKYRGLLSSSQTEETLANFAGWEPPHGKFLMFGYPWKQYVKVGAALRHCAYATMALHGCVRAEVQAPYELRQVFSAEILKVTDDAVELLKQLSSNVWNMRRCQQTDELLTELIASTELLQKSVDSNSHLFINPGVIKAPPLVNNPSFEHTAEPIADMDNLPANHHPQQTEDLRTIHTVNRLRSYTSLSICSIRSASNFSVATFTSLLIEMVARLENLVEAVECLSELARFKRVTENIQHKDGRLDCVAAARSNDIRSQNNNPNAGTE